MKESSAKKCPAGKYWCYTGKKCKKKAPATGRMSELERRKVLRSLSMIG